MSGEAESHSCLDKLPLPAYDCVMKCSHAFNLLLTRGALSAVERAALSFPAPLLRHAG